MSARILIIDDHEVLREGLRSLFAKLRPAWEICGEGADGEQAIRLTQELQPDLVLLDITMPGMSGLEASSRIRKLGLTVPILIFTTHQSERLSTEVQQAGGQGYVLKSQAARDLVVAMDTLLSGGTFFGSAIKPEPQTSKAPKSGLLFRQGFALAT
jgi:two-component system, NarL family, nitrate/nitrite response regulator NarL